MNYFEAPEDYSGDEGVKVFMAGGIGNCEDWQSQMADYLSDTEMRSKYGRRER